jgi:sugar O-acyltransferase (sialic acid O-acetyltransferase NeuD family)
MMRQAVVVGTGGHCRVVLSLLAACGDHEVVGLVDLELQRAGEVIMGVPVIGAADCLEGFRGRTDLDVFLALGANETRLAWWHSARNLGLSLPNLVSPRAVIDSRARLGGANVVCAMAFIGPEAVLGDNNLVNTAAVVEHEAVVGSHCHLAPSSTVAGRSRIGDGCFVGAGATVIDYVELAPGITVGAGGTVVRTITEPGGVYVGTPAKRTAAR